MGGGRDECEWTRNVEIRARKNFLAAGEACKAHYSRLSRENICQLWALNGSDLNFCVGCIPTAGRISKLCIILALNMLSDVTLQPKVQVAGSSKDVRIHPTIVALKEVT